MNQGPQPIRSLTLWPSICCSFFCLLLTPTCLADITPTLRYRPQKCPESLPVRNASLNAPRAWTTTPPPPSPLLAAAPYIRGDRKKDPCACGVQPRRRRRPVTISSQGPSEPYHYPKYDGSPTNQLFSTVAAAAAAAPGPLHIPSRLHLECLVAHLEPPPPPTLKSPANSGCCSLWTLPVAARNLPARPVSHPFSRWWRCAVSFPTPTQVRNNTTLSPHICQLIVSNAASRALAPTDASTRALACGVVGRTSTSAGQHTCP